MREPCCIVPGWVGRLLSRLILGGLVCGILLMGASTGAWAASVPPVLQAAIFKKVLSLTPDFAAKKKVAIAYSDGKDDALVMKKAFAGLGFEAEVVKDYGLISQEAELVYLVQTSDETESFCNKKRVLCFAGSVAAVELGFAEVAVGSRRNKPKIFLNLKRINLKGIKIRQELVQLAEVVEE